MLRQRYGAVSLVDDALTPNGNTSDSWARPLLCQSCERDFNERFDQYGTSFLNAKAGRFDAIDGGVRIEGVDQQRLAAFITSVVWRASVSDHPGYAKLFALAPATKRALYDSLLLAGSGPGLPYIAVARLVDSAGVFSRKALREVVVSPFLSTARGNQAATFIVISGFVFVLFFNRPTLRMRRSICLLSTKAGRKPFFVPSRSFDSFPPLFNLMVNALRKEHAGLTKVRPEV